MSITKSLSTTNRVMKTDRACGTCKFNLQIIDESTFMV